MKAVKVTAKKKNSKLRLTEQRHVSCCLNAYTRNSKDYFTPMLQNQSLPLQEVSV